MNPWFNVLFTAGMISAPALFVALWCYWTGVRGLERLLGGTLAVLVGFGVTAFIFVPVRFHPFYFLWGLLGFWVVLAALGIPFIRKHFRELPAVPRGASLKPRRVELFKGAWVWPFVAWALLTATMFFGPSRPLVWLGPLLGLIALLVARFGLRYSVLEGEPLGGGDPEEMRLCYERFRQRRVKTMYWLMVTLALFITSGVLLPGHSGLVGVIVGPAIGLWGAVFGTWADAQRYLLRLQLSGEQPPA